MQSSLNLQVKKRRQLLKTLKQQYPLPFLHHILKDYDFNPKELPKILTALSQPGRQFSSATHTLLTDRDFFYIYRTPAKISEKKIEIKSFIHELTDPINLKFLVVEKRGIRNPIVEIGKGMDLVDRQVLQAAAL